MCETKVVEKIETHKISAFFLNFTVCGIMWKNAVEPERPQMTMRRMRFACWITKAIDTLRICNVYCFSPAKVVTRTRLITFYLHCLSCFDKLMFFALLVTFAHLEAVESASAPRTLKSGLASRDFCLESLHGALSLRS
jgi:hypothetical protein